MAKRAWIYWTPRILSILIIVFFGAMSLDVFDPSYTAWDMAIGFLMHNIPTFILIAALVAAWRRPKIGAYVFGIAGLLYIINMIYNMLRYEFEPYMVSYIFIVAGPLLATAYLWYLNDKSR